MKSTRRLATRGLMFVVMALGAACDGAASDSAASADNDIAIGEQGSGTPIPESELALDSTNDTPSARVVEAPEKVVLPFTWQGQPNGYWCGPGAVRIALTTRMEDPPSQDTLAQYMGTTTSGTSYIGLPVKALNKWLTPEVSYVMREMRDPPTEAQRDLLKSDLLARLSTGHPIVANVVSGWRPPNYPTGMVYHYVAVVGYDQNGESVLIADPAAEGSAGPKWKDVPRTYWITLRNLGTWIGGKGYSG